MATKLQIRRDTASNWTSANPTLSAGELGFETDTLKLKIGTGSTAWSSLSYFVGDVTGYLGGGNVQHIIPAGNELYDLGDSDSRFRDLYLSGSTIKLGSVTLSVDSGTNALVLPTGTQLGNVAVLDSAGVQNVINQTYIRANQIQYNTSDFADSSFVTTQVNALVDAAPGALNTLNELAAALGDDANFSTTITNSIAGKLDSAATTTLIDSSYVQARQTTGGSVDSAATISLINSNTNSGFSKFRYTATANQTVFKDSDASGNILAFDPNSTVVFYNGIMLDETSDYTVGSNEITLTSGADAGVSLSIVKFGVGYIAPNKWYGDRGIVAGGTSGSADNRIQYFNINTTSNTTDFGDLTQSRYEKPGGVGDATYAVFSGGRTSSSSNVIDYITVSTTGNAVDFGNLTQSRRDGGSPSNATRGLYGGGYASGDVNTIDYITIATPGDATDFGDLASANRGVMAGMNLTRALFASDNIAIDYVTFDTPGNSTTFGSLSSNRYGGAGISDQTRTIFGGGWAGSRTNVIDYVTTDTTGNATDFGDLTMSRIDIGPVGNETRGVFCGGNNSNYTSGTNTMDYVTIQTTGNASSFGNLAAICGGPAGASGNAS